MGTAVLYRVYRPRRTTYKGARARKVTPRVRLLTLIPLLMGVHATMAYETPHYTVDETIGDEVEVRSYDPMLLAEVEVGGDRGQAVSSAFRILAGYIFGDNEPQAKIAMTAPVLQSAGSDGERIEMTAPVGQEKGEDGRWRVSFMMPSKYSRETIPEPLDPRITLRHSAAYRAVVLRFSGLHSDRNFDRHLEQLERIVAEKGIATTGPAMLAYYDAPFKPWFLRRNEVMYRLAE